ncbi:MAG: UDP-2,3-diacylglucosamine diphosphatase [Rhodothermaceae bacterium]|nr:UDP-2,3-diacylglucosamine diphosphatase [Rhodothermaceae bacterium]
MTLFLSDLHLGRGAPAEQAAAERDLVALLRAYEDEIVNTGGALYLVGDVFDQYLEYRHLVPKGAIRFLGLLAGWADQGVPITYLVGNRDPWHLDYVERELGLRLVRDTLTQEVEGHHAYIAHGDAVPIRNPLHARLRLLLRSPFMARLYRMSLPGDAGYAFARWFARRFGSGGAVGAQTSATLQNRAEILLTETDAELVVFGHCHEAACISLAGGAYLNPGYWFADRTFGTLTAEGPALHRWHGDRAEPLADLRPASLSL